MAPRPVRWTAANGTALTMRLARDSDTPQVKAALDKLSPEARRNRFFSPMPGFSDQLVKQLTEVDPAREHVLFVVRKEQGIEHPVAGGRFVISLDAFTGLPTRCDFALVVGDLWQRQGIGRRIMQGLIDEAVARHLQQMYGHILEGNDRMLALARSWGFRIEECDEPGVQLAVLDLPRNRSRGWRKLLTVFQP